MQPKRKPDQEKLLEQSLAAFLKAGTIDLSLDQLATSVGISKRMLVHYFGGRENIEEGAMALFEERLRAQFSPESFPAGASPKAVLMALWEQTTAPQSLGVLLLVMNVSRRAWNGSARAKGFYDEQQRLWVRVFIKFLRDTSEVDQVLQLFQGAVLAYLITGDPEPGRRSLARYFSSQRKSSATEKATVRTRKRV